MNIYESQKIPPIWTRVEETVRPLNIYTCAEDEVKSSIKISNIIIYLPIRAGWFKRFMIKHCFGLDMRGEKARFPHA